MISINGLAVTVEDSSNQASDATFLARYNPSSSQKDLRDAKDRQLSIGFRDDTSDRPTAEQLASRDRPVEVVSAQIIIDSSPVPRPAVSVADTADALLSEPLETLSQFAGEAALTGREAEATAGVQLSAPVRAIATRNDLDYTFEPAATAVPGPQFIPQGDFFLADSGVPSFDTLLWSPSRPDSHAPIGVMGDHTHEQGEVMLSYRYMFMDMDGNRDGTDSLSTAEVLQDFPITPTSMTMQMHMFGAMYAPTNELTLMAMVPYILKEMDHATRRGTEFTTNSEGFGDIRLSGLYKVLDQNRQRIHLNLGLSFPTGSIEERDTTPAGPDQILPYPMQIGSGTFDLHPGVTYLGQSGRWSWGSQAMGILRLGENSNGYRLGNQLMLTAWGARSWTDWFSTSVRLGGRTLGNIDGEDDRLNPNLIPTANPDLRAGTQLDLGLGLNFYVPQGALQGARLAVEFNLPVYRSLSGPQLETDYSITAGLQAVF
ncbi:MAG: transporter [Cyanobacteria bacterium P01_C01_bin.120]